MKNIDNLDEWQRVWNNLEFDFLLQYELHDELFSLSLTGSNVCL
jgi:hypothetical protein